LFSIIPKYNFSCNRRWRADVLRGFPPFAIPLFYKNWKGKINEKR